MTGEFLLNWLKGLDSELLKLPIEIGHRVDANRDFPEHDAYHLTTKVVCDYDYYNPSNPKERIKVGPHPKPGKLAILIR